MGPWCYTTDPTSRWEYCSPLVEPVVVEPVVEDPVDDHMTSEECHEADCNDYRGF